MQLNTSHTPTYCCIQKYFSVLDSLRSCLCKGRGWLKQRGDKALQRLAPLVVTVSIHTASSVYLSSYLSLTAEFVFTVIRTGSTRGSNLIRLPSLKVSSVKINPTQNWIRVWRPRAPCCFPQHVKWSHGGYSKWVSRTLESNGRHKNRCCWSKKPFHSQPCRSCSTPPGDKHKKCS